MPKTFNDEKKAKNIIADMWVSFVLDKAKEKGVDPRNVVLSFDSDGTLVMHTWDQHEKVASENIKYSNLDFFAIVYKKAKEAGLNAVINSRQFLHATDETNGNPENADLSKTYSNENGEGFGELPIVSRLEIKRKEGHAEKGKGRALRGFLKGDGSKEYTRNPINVSEVGLVVAIDDEGSVCGEYKEAFGGSKVVAMCGEEGVNDGFGRAGFVPSMRGWKVNNQAINQEMIKGARGIAINTVTGKEEEDELKRAPFGFCPESALLFLIDNGVNIPKELLKLAQFTRLDSLSRVAEQQIIEHLEGRLANSLGIAENRKLAKNRLAASAKNSRIVDNYVSIADRMAMAQLQQPKAPLPSSSASSVEAASRPKTPPLDEAKKEKPQERSAEFEQLLEAAVKEGVVKKIEEEDMVVFSYEEEKSKTSFYLFKQGIAYELTANEQGERQLAAEYLAKNIKNLSEAIKQKKEQKSQESTLPQAVAGSGVVSEDMSKRSQGQEGFRPSAAKQEKPMVELKSSVASPSHTTPAAASSKSPANKDNSPIGVLKRCLEVIDALREKGAIAVGVGVTKENNKYTYADNSGNKYTYKFEGNKVHYEHAGEPAVILNEDDINMYKNSFLGIIKNIKAELEVSKRKPSSIINPSEHGMVAGSANQEEEEVYL